MHAVLLVIGIGWVVFWLFWLVAAFGAKASRGGLGRYAVARVVLLVVVVLLIRSNWGGGGGPKIGDDPVLVGVGFALWVAGLGVAIWARLYIGTNWGMPMTRREHPDLVTTGPYRYVRHPIYSGIILAFTGTALATTLLGLIGAALIAAYFTFSATREEHFLAGEFPDTFPAYKASTKMLVPFVF